MGTACFSVLGRKPRSGIYVVVLLEGAVETLASWGGRVGKGSMKLSLHYYMCSMPLPMLSTVTFVCAAAWFGTPPLLHARPWSLPLLIITGASAPDCQGGRRPLQSWWHCLYRQHGPGETLQHTGTPCTRKLGHARNEAGCVGRQVMSY